MAQSKKAGLVQGAEESDQPLAERAIVIAGSDYGVPARKRTVKVSAAGLLQFTGAITGTVDQGTPNAGGTAAWPIQGGDTEGAAVTTKPVTTGAKDASGNVQPFRAAVMADVNAVLTPAVTAQRVLADLMVQHAAGNNTNRVRSGADLVGGVAGGSIPGVGSSVHDGSVFRPRVGDTSGRQVVVGGAATGAAVAGSPVLMGAGTTAAGGNAQSLWVESAASPNLRAVIYQGANPAAVSNYNVQDTGGIGGTALVVSAVPALVDGSVYARARVNVDFTLLTSASRTTTQTSADITTYNLRGINVTLDMTVVGTGSVTVSIDGKDLASGKYYNLLTGAAIVTNSTNVYKIALALTAVANAVANDRLPRLIRIVVTANNANAATYTVGYTLTL